MGNRHWCGYLVSTGIVGGQLPDELKQFTPFEIDADLGRYAW
jgi:hypothetical protein